MFQPNFCIFLYPFVKKEIVALLLNRNTEAGRLLGGSTGILEHFSAALHEHGKVRNASVFFQYLCFGMCTGSTIISDYKVTPNSRFRRK